MIKDVFRKKLMPGAVSLSMLFHDATCRWRGIKKAVQPGEGLNRQGLGGGPRGWILEKKSIPKADIQSAL